MLNIITAACFLFVMSLVWLVGRALLKPRRNLAYARVPTGQAASLSMGVGEKPGALIESLAGQLPQSLLAGEELERDFRRAGYYHPNSRKRFLALRNGLVILAVIGAGGIAVALGPQHERAAAWIVVLGGIAALLCFALPRVILAIQARRRVERIRNSLPDAMDTISMCLHGGISLQECVGYVGQEMLSVHPDLGVELLMVGQQADINSFEFAIQQFASRIDAPEVVAMATLVTQNQRLGTGIVDSIRDFADSLRLKQRQTAEAKASRAELFLLFPVVFCLVPSILLILWGPPVLTLIEFISGPASPLRIGM